MRKEMSKTCLPSDYEQKIYQRWEKSGFFNPDNLALPKKAKPYTIVLPPPNITDKLHMGHSAMLAIEDLLIRYHRMNGYRALWLPGTDHAAIATQNAVEKKLLKEKGLTRHDLGKKRFLDEVWKFIRQTQTVILKQTRRMGSSLDWSREAFTLDETRKESVKKMFVDMYAAGAIYQGERVVNWCPRCLSTLSDDEVEYENKKSFLYTFKYDKTFPFYISTTRPETKLGDVAVAVNPNDKRYKKFIGKIYPVNFCGCPLKIKIIAEPSIDMNFGAGAVGVTPAHSMTDWNMAQKHKLPLIKVIDEKGHIRKNFGRFSKLNTLKAREEIIRTLKKNNLIIEEKEIENNLSVCYRCGTAIEPLPSKQWFVDVDKKLKKLGGKSLKEKAIETVKNKKIKFTPKRFEKRYLDWMENLHDWCISRQIWFGHEIPAWRKKISTEIFLVRHTQTDWNAKKIMQSQTDTDLNKTGIQQAYELKEKLKNEKIDVIISSPLKRAIKTAQIINSFGLPIIKDDRLKERFLCAKYEGKKMENLVKEYPEVQTMKKNGTTYWIDAPGTESYKSLRKRVGTFLDEIRKKYAGKKVLIVSHRDTLDMLYAELNDLPNEKAYGKFSRNGCLHRHSIKDDQLFVGLKKPSGREWKQDSDSLDTWFSSGMWTFSTLGWPKNIKYGKKTGDLLRFHPTQLLETGYDILTLWVSRMIMLTLFALNEVPFEEVYLHGLVLDKKGKKMSKSKGNGVDPIDMIEKYGADATRLSLLIGSSAGNDIRLFEEKIQGQRNFINKLWNISRFIITNHQAQKAQNKENELFDKDLTIADSWILNQMKKLIKEVSQDIKKKNFSNAGEKLKEFTWNDFADWYLEVSKVEKNVRTKTTILNKILVDLLKLWHPFIPFVTEEIYAQLFPGKILMIAPYPDSKEYPLKNKKDADAFEPIKEIITAIRSFRAEYKIPPLKEIDLILFSNKFEKILAVQSGLIKELGHIKNISVRKSGQRPPKSFCRLIPSIKIFIPLEKIIDLEKEKKTLKIEKKEIEIFISSIKNKLKNKNFIRYAPREIVEKEKTKLIFQKDKLTEIKKRLKNFE
ncbi:MAG: class I tRNA ligase family protein [Candidatus Moranbacteria bacterium]|nr:class I tRNA ligase family protein [Candidatus Moranbacteria bacterium]